MPQPGEAFAGKYVILRSLGEGGMGVVYEALHRRLKKRVAIKTLQAEALRHTDLIARFEREARAAVALKGPNVARVLDVDNLPDGTPFLVMELLEGVDLSGEMAAREIPVGEAVGYLLEACAAMSEAHALGIVHRDLKPSNLFISEHEGQRRVKVLDFGISKLVREREVSVTSTQSTLGTPLYMSPEQIRSAKSVDTRSDIWSLGVILYELLAGKPPFYDQSASAVVAAIAADPVPPLAGVRPGLPEPLTVAVMKALEKDPLRRYQTVEDFAAAIAPFGEALSPLDGARASLPSHARLAAKQLDETLAAIDPPPSRPTGGVAPAPTPAGAWAQPTGRTTPARRRWTVVALAGAGVVALLALSGLRGTAATDLRAPLSSPAADEPAPSAPAPPPPAAAPSATAAPLDSAPAPPSPALSSKPRRASGAPPPSPRPQVTAAPVDTVAPLHL